MRPADWREQEHGGDKQRIIGVEAVAEPGLRLISTIEEMADTSKTETVRKAARWLIDGIPTALTSGGRALNRDQFVVTIPYLSAR